MRSALRTPNSWLATTCDPDRLGERDGDVDADSYLSVGYGLENDARQAAGSLRRLMHKAGLDYKAYPPFKADSSKATK
jgi:hypothetical protein